MTNKVNGTKHCDIIYEDDQADKLYEVAWGESIHFGIYESPSESIETATERAKNRMSAPLQFTSGDIILEVGCGYGALARYLALEYGCKIVATNFSPKQLAKAERMTQGTETEQLIKFEWADYHDLPYDDEQFNYWWCQEAIAHSEDKPLVFREAYRILKPGGKLILSEQLVSNDSLSQSERKRIVDRHKSDDLWNASDFEKALTDAGFTIEISEDWSEHIATHFNLIIERTIRKRQEIEKDVNESMLQRTLDIWNFWERAGAERKIGWGYFVAVKDH